MTNANRSIVSRRRVLTALTRAAGATVASSSGGAERRRVGIVGGGMAGVALAWLLDGPCDVVLLEAQPSLGGNVETIQVDVGGQALAVDVGAQYFHPNLYTLYCRLLALLGLYPPLLKKTHSFPASISLFDGSEPFPRIVSPVLWDRLWPIFAPWNWEGLSAFSSGFNSAKIREDKKEDWTLTLEAWLPTLSLSRHQWEGMLLPWAASLFTGDTQQARYMSARAAMIFAATAVPANPADPVVSYVIDRGMAEPLRRMVQQMEQVEIMVGARVAQVVRQPQGGFLLACDDGRRRRVDELVLACSGPASLRLLQELPSNHAQQSALRGIDFDSTRIALHTDPAYAPPDPNHWSFLNCEIHNRYCESSMWLAKVLTPSPVAQSGLKLWKSWVTHRDKQPRNVLHESSFRHMVPTVATIRAQAILQSLQGHDGVSIIGGYTFPFDCQETALVSALQVAVRLNVISARFLALASERPGNLIPGSE